jgi:4'-phosphopantetheinyl transferase
MLSQESWSAPLPASRLAAGEVHVWQASIACDDQTLHTLGATLSRDECARAARFASVLDARAFVATRGVLRILLGYYLQRDPASITFDRGPHGKPHVANCGDRASALSFNVSCSGAQALLAFARGCEIGVDIEQHKPIPDLGSVVAFALSPFEVAALLELPARERLAAFFAYWSAKEALLKLTGEGLHRPLRSFDVSFTPDGLPHVRRAGDLPPDGASGHRPCSFSGCFAPLPQIDGYSSALAVQNEHATVRYWRLDARRRALETAL